jgi:hypothetical protein
MHSPQQDWEEAAHDQSMMKIEECASENSSSLVD